MPITRHLGHLVILNLTMVLLMHLMRMLSVLEGIRQSIWVWHVRIPVAVAKFQEHIPPIMRILSRRMVGGCWQIAGVIIAWDIGSMVTPNNRPTPRWHVRRIDILWSIGMGVQRSRWGGPKRKRMIRMLHIDLRSRTLRRNMRSWRTYQ